jgi:peptidoglycan/LPS O-acetylase OafA/YrhL
MLNNPKHRDNAFDLIRFLAASAVLFSHNFATSGRPEPTYFAEETAGSIGVFAFFSVSGYLVQQSWDRKSDPLTFALARILRIFPGLLVCLMICAFVIGPYISMLPITTYFLQLDVYQFIYSNLAMFFIPRYDSLPGVFLDNAFPKHVNSSLWTIRFEVFMYVLLLSVSYFFRNKQKLLIAGLLMLLCALWAYGKQTGLDNPGQLLWRLDIIGLDGRILKLAPFFLVGSLIAQAPNHFLSVKWAALLCILTAFFYHSSNGIVALWFTLPYCLLVFAHNAPDLLNRFGRHGDFSYGLYLYAFPVQQLMAYYRISTSNWLLGFSMTFVIALSLSILSWWFVESPSLGLRSRLRNLRTSDSPA